MRGQSTQEFLFTLPLVFLLFTGLLLLFYMQASSFVQAQEQARSRELGHAFRGAWDAVYLAGDGASYAFSSRYLDRTVVLYPGILQVRANASALEFALLTTAHPTGTIPGNLTILHRGGSLEVQ